MGAIQNDTYWLPVTQFATDDTGEIGFSVGWLEDDPESPDPSIFLCTVVAEHPYVESR